MAMDDAAALAAKVLSDADLAKKLNEAKTEDEFNKIIAKLGYNTTAAEFKTAFDKARSGSKELSDAQLEQVAGGLSLVGVDYTFTVVKTVNP